MLQFVPQVFLRIEPFVFNLPPQSATVSSSNNVLPILSNIGDVSKPLDLSCFVYYIYNGFITLHPGEMPFIIFNTVQVLVFERSPGCFGCPVNIFLSEVAFRSATSC